MGSITTDQVLLGTLSTACALLAASVRFSAAGIFKRLESMEAALKSATEQIIGLVFADKAKDERLDRQEEETQELKMKMHELTKVVTVLKLTQERCRTCSPRD